MNVGSIFQLIREMTNGSEAQISFQMKARLKPFLNLFGCEFSSEKSFEHKGPKGTSDFIAILNLSVIFRGEFKLNNFGSVFDESLKLLKSVLL